MSAGIIYNGGIDRCSIDIRDKRPMFRRCRRGWRPDSAAISATRPRAAHDDNAITILVRNYPLLCPPGIPRAFRQSPLGALVSFRAIAARKGRREPAGAKMIPNSRRIRVNLEVKGVLARWQRSPRVEDDHRSSTCDCRGIVAAVFR
jgi:hypothetical protein